ncbi:MAG: asparagine synthetase B, partial [Ignavibacterium sp.]|nr:asparagine synthetase B [Ignavibacterium sp.]
MKKIITNISVLFVLFTFQLLSQNKILIPMDLTQTDHLKAYGITFHALLDGLKA